jgi:hypothetical protein
MEPIEVSETSENNHLTPGNYPKESILQTYIGYTNRGGKWSVGYLDDNTEVFDGIVAAPPHLDISRFSSRNSWCLEGQAGTVWEHTEP